MQEQDIENKNYTYVSVITNRNPMQIEKFLVHSPYKEEALRLAQRYVENQSWDLQDWSDGDLYKLYPHNYIREARRLFAENKFI